MLRKLGLLMTILVLAANSSAGVGSDDFLITGTGSYVIGTSEQTDQTIDGS